MAGGVCIGPEHPYLARLRSLIQHVRRSMNRGIGIPGDGPGVAPKVQGIGAAALHVAALYLAISQVVAGIGIRTVGPAETATQSSSDLSEFVSARAALDGIQIGKVVGVQADYIYGIEEFSASKIRACAKRRLEVGERQVAKRIAFSEVGGVAVNIGQVRDGRVRVVDEGE